MSNLQQEQRLGKYPIDSELGRGGFATVYHAQDTVLHRSVALKVLHPILLTDPAFVTRFESEVRAVAQFEHPHIATIYELGQYEGRICIAMQLLSGGSLTDRIRQHGPLSYADAVRAIGEVAEALDHAHAAGFIHRDVKPSNILFNARGAAVLTDFGLVKAAEGSVIARTTMGSLLGTPPYMAPEVWEGKGDSPATDVYALGCVVYEMLTGELLFKGDTPPQVMLNHFQPRKYPEHWPAGTPQGVTQILERALAREPADRYASAVAFAADLAALAAQAADTRVLSPKELQPVQEPAKTGNGQNQRQNEESAPQPAVIVAPSAQEAQPIQERVETADGQAERQSEDTVPSERGSARPAAGQVSSVTPNVWLFVVLNTFGSALAWIVSGLMIQSEKFTLPISTATGGAVSAVVLALALQRALLIPIGARGYTLIVAGWTLAGQAVAGYWMRR
jgi:serine/threonine-protein kinase